MDINICGTEKEVIALVEAIQGRYHHITATIDGEKLTEIVTTELNEYLKKATGDTATTDDVTNIPRVAEVLLDHATRLK